MTKFVDTAKHNRNILKKRKHPTFHQRNTPKTPKKNSMCVFKYSNQPAFNEGASSSKTQSLKRTITLPSPDKCDSLTIRLKQDGCRDRLIHAYFRKMNVISHSDNELILETTDE